jgi:alkanesulfonate monooxygenase SsuD/methylene tetrahydromethanopterin reductase-like flavin-dependent oxidoreductase (luciferase family)
LAAQIADRGHSIACFPGPSAVVRRVFDVYRNRYAELGQPAPGLDKFAYYGHVVFVGDTDEEALREAEKIRLHVAQIKAPPQFDNIPGYLASDVRAKRMSAESAAGNGGPAADLPIDRLQHMATAPIRDLGPEDGFFIGNPDTVFEQLRDFYEKVGGFGHFVMMMHCGGMSYDLTVRSMERFSRDVLPRFREEVHQPALAASA